MTTTLTPTPEQEKIFAASLAGKSFQIRALAGTGKTTTIVQALERIPKSGLFLAFNKSIQVELSEKISSRHTALTMNALGYQSIRQVIGYQKINPLKMWQLAEEAQISWAVRKDVVELTKRARNAGIVPNALPNRSQWPQGLEPDTDRTWKELLNDIVLVKENLDKDELIFQSRKLLETCIQTAISGQILDFDDQLFLPAIFSRAFKLPKHSLIACDEVQDFSPLQHTLLQKTMATDCQLITVGDPNQSIYGFRGADQNSMEKLKNTFGLEELPLTNSFRCPTKVVAQAQRIVPEIRAWEHAKPGSVSSEPFDLNSPTLEPKSAVVCRNNGPLFKLGMSLLARDVPFYFTGDDVAKRLTDTIKLLTKGKNLKSADLLKRAERWAAAQSEKSPHQEGVYKDILTCFEALAQYFHTTDEMQNQLGKLFTKRHTQAVCLTSIHRAKGLEWNTVYFLNSFMIPSKYAKSDSAIQQEMNLKYVAITRAKQNLIYIDIEV